jgi:wyosine [tRNA(Phe)-imidazoG37] synthetase (radical SAM superfamily)
MPRLTLGQHDRDSTGMKYVYAVVSRRAQGVSVGVNLNPNNACNWRCIYCQVPNLVRGKAPEVDFAQLEDELDRMLGDIVDGSFMEERVEPAFRRLNDIALSGNGESTTALEFPEVVELIGRMLDKYDLLGQAKLVLITNGSMIDQPRVLGAIARMAELNGEVWFKLDRATKSGLSSVNSVKMDPEDHLARLRTVARLCPTKIQTCMFALDGEVPADEEVEAYVGAIEKLIEEQVPLRGVLIYGLARESHQAEASRLSRVSEEWLAGLGERIAALGLDVKVTP